MRVVEVLMFDKIKLLIAVLLVIAGVVGFYVLPDVPALVRVLMVLGGLVAGAAVTYFTAPGKAFFAFAGEARDETRKVVWPTRKETIQTTAIVLVFVMVMALFLWVVDSILLWVVGLALGGGN
jgi:preprotein translocase subunit SecE